MKKSPILSICIPTFNRSDFIGRTIMQFIRYIEEKPFLQSSVEIIAADNCSEDKTWSVLQKLDKQYNCVRVARNRQNIGLPKNILKLIRMAKGDYLWFFGDDDRLIKNELSEILDILEARKPNFILHNFFTFKDGRKENVRVVNQNFLNTKHSQYFPTKRYLTSRTYKIITNGVLLLTSNIVKKEVAASFTSELIDNNYWHFYHIVKQMIKNGKLYVFASPTVGQRTTTSHFHKNIRLKFKTFFCDLTEILLLFKKEFPSFEFKCLKKAIKLYIKYSFFTLAIMLRNNDFSKGQIRYIENTLKQLYFDLGLIFWILLNMPKSLLYLILKCFESIRYIKLGKVGQNT